MNEQRVYSRISTQVFVDVEVQEAPGAIHLQGCRLQCQTRDISMTGICLYTGVELPVDTVLRIRIGFGSTERTFPLSGKVIWTVQEASDELYKAGIHLTRLPEDSGAWNNAVLQALVT